MEKQGAERGDGKLIKARRPHIGLRGLLLCMTLIALFAGVVGIYRREQRRAELEQLVRYRRDVGVESLNRQILLHPEQAEELQKQLKNMEVDFHIVLENLRRGTNP